MILLQELTDRVSLMWRSRLFISVNWHAWHVIWEPIWFGYSPGMRRPDIPYASQYAMVVEGLKMAGKIAAQYGVTLVVQNHHDIAVHHDAMKWLLDEVNLPNVKAAFDLWSPTMEGLSTEEIKKAIYTMKPYILHTTTADYEKLPRFRYESRQVNYEPLLPENRLVPIGEGYLDYKTFINTLKEIGYQGYIAFEMCAELKGGGSIENLDKTAKAFLEYVKQFEYYNSLKSISLQPRGAK